MWTAGRRGRQRRRNRQGALDCIVERVREVPVTASAVVAAIRLGAKLDREAENDEADGEWAEQEFVLSLDGLPRANAVTGRVGHGECATRTLRPFERADNAE